MSSLDGLLGKVLDNGIELELGNGLDFQHPLKASRNAATESIEVSYDATAQGAYTVVNGAIQLLSLVHDIILDTEGGAGTDNLDSITWAADVAMPLGFVIVLHDVSGVRDVTVRDFTAVGAPPSNIHTVSATSFAIATTNHRIALMWSGTYWQELWRSTT